MNILTNTMEAVNMALGGTVEADTLDHTAGDDVDALLDAAIEQSEDIINADELFDVMVESIVHDDLSGLVVAVNASDSAEAGKVILGLIKKHRFNAACANHGIES